MFFRQEDVSIYLYFRKTILVIRLEPGCRRRKSKAGNKAQEVTAPSRFCDHRLCERDQVLLPGKGGRDEAGVRNSKDSHRESQALLIKQPWEGEDTIKGSIR